MPNPIGRAWFVSEMPWRMITAVDVAIATPNPDRVDAQFLTYLLNSPMMLEHCERRAVGATRARISRRELAALPVVLPSRRVQARIAEVLCSYDDLIRNDRRRMELLDRMARLVYEEWFVRLRFPGYEGAGIVDGVLDGWLCTTLGIACESLEDGDWIESKDQGGEDYRLIQVSNIGVNEFIETGSFRFITEETFRRLNCREVKPGQILVSRMPKPIGRAWLVTETPWKMVTAVDVAILAPNEGVVDRYFMAYHLNSNSIIELCERRAVGATRSRIARRELAALPIVVPPMTLQRAFRDVVEPMYRQRANLFRQIGVLRAARDLLLPRLISGKIEV
jgi:Restriction endonuclease S subunits